MLIFRWFLLCFLKRSFWWFLCTFNFCSTYKQKRWFLIQGVHREFQRLSEGTPRDINFCSWSNEILIFCYLRANRYFEKSIVLFFDHFWKNGKWIFGLWSTLEVSKCKNTIKTNAVLMILWCALQNIAETITYVMQIE